MNQILWGAPLVAGLAALQLSCSGDSHYQRSGFADYPVTWVAVADLNGDGLVDIVDAVHFEGGGAAASGWVSARVQDPAARGTYLDPVQTAAGANPAFLVAARLSPAGNPGVVVANRQLAPGAGASNQVSVLFPDPAVPGGFKAPVALPVGTRNPVAAAVGDLDGDTYPDVVVAADGASTLLLFTQQAPGGTFAAPVALAAGGEPTSVAVADLNGDGLADIVATTSGNQVSVFLQDPAHPGSFLPRVDYAVGVHPVAVAVADLNGDGLPDLVVANNGTGTAPTTQGVSVLLQASGGAFQPAVTYDAGDAFASAVAVGDLDGDGRPDIVVANAGVPGDPGSVAVLIQDGTGAFKAPVRYGGVQGPGSVAIADVDGDGLPDLVLGDGGLFVRFQIPGRPGVFGPPAQYRQ
ncbi:FG-GAP repeat domain-containing protein [Mesoterricola silvestris]|nr:VCBS repeat-containing protein [Mesoterricola silvestris]